MNAKRAMKYNSKYYQVAAMSAHELCAVFAGLEIESGGYIGGLKSAVNGEVLHRLRHPITWKIKHLWSVLKDAFPRPQ